MFIHLHFHFILDSDYLLSLEFGGLLSIQHRYLIHLHYLHFVKQWLMQQLHP